MRKGFPQMRREAGAATLGVRAARTERAWHFLELREASAVGFAAMGDTINDNAMDGVFDCVEDAVATNPEPVGVRVSFEFLRVERSGAARQRLDGSFQGRQDLLGQTFQLAGRRRGIEDLVQRQLTLPRRELWPSASAARADGT